MDWGDPFRPSSGRIGFRIGGGDVGCPLPEDGKGDEKGRPEQDIDRRLDQDRRCRIVQTRIGGMRNGQRQSPDELFVTRRGDGESVSADGDQFLKQDDHAAAKGREQEFGGPFHCRGNEPGG